MQSRKLLLLSLLAAFPCMAQNSPISNNNADDAMPGRPAFNFPAESNAFRVSSPNRLPRNGEEGWQETGPGLCSDRWNRHILLSVPLRNGFGGMDRAIAEARGGNEPVILMTMSQSCSTLTAAEVRT